MIRLALLFFYSYGTYVAAIMELENKNSNKVKNVFCVMDCGLYINPDIVKAQIEGSVVFALSLSKRTMITLKNGCVEQSNFDDYEILRMNEMPNVHVHLMDNQYDPGGVGEPCIPVFMAAYANCLNYDKVERKAILPLTKKFDV